MKKARLIINPIAGHGLAPRIAQLIDASGIRSHYEIETITTERAGHAAVLSAEAAQQHYDAVIAVGGDGTVNETASALVGTKTALGIIPAGSGNGLARHLGMKTKHEKALHQLVSADPQAIDTLRINGRFAVNVSGLGFDGYVAWLFNHSSKRGLSNYTRIAMQEYFRYKAVGLTIEADGKKINKEAHMLVIANASQFGNAALIAPQADLHDGKVDVVIVKRPGLLQLPGTFYRLFTGKLKDNNNIQTIPCKKLTVKADRPVHLHIDGEAVEPLSELHVEVLPASLHVLIPHGN